MEDNARMPNPMRKSGKGEKEEIERLKKLGINQKTTRRRGRRGSALRKKAKHI